MGSDLGRELADWLDGWMRSRKLSKTQLHRSSGLSRPAIDAILAGERQGVEQSTLDALTRALSIDPVRIEPRLTGEPPARPETPGELLEQIKELAERAQRLLPSALPGDGDEARRVAQRAEERRTGKGRLRKDRPA